MFLGTIIEYDKNTNKHITPDIMSISFFTLSQTECMFNTALYIVKYSTIAFRIARFLSIRHSTVENTQAYIRDNVVNRFEK